MRLLIILSIALFFSSQEYYSQGQNNRFFNYQALVIFCCFCWFRFFWCKHLCRDDFVVESFEQIYEVVKQDLIPVMDEAQKLGMYAPTFPPKEK